MSKKKIKKRNSIFLLVIICTLIFICCDYQVRSPFLQDEAILTEQDYLKMKALIALYSVAIGDDTYLNFLYSISNSMNEILKKEEYKVDKTEVKS